MKLSIIIPAYNEEKRLQPTLDAVRAYVIKRDLKAEVLVVDDGSSDGTAELVHAAQKKYYIFKLIQQEKNRGKGAAVARGAIEAQGDIVLFSDADLSTPIEELDRLLPLIEEGLDVVVGSRAMARSQVLKRQPFYRHFGGKVFNLAVRAVTLSGFSDTQCGFKIFKNQVGKKLFSLQKIHGFGFDVEFLYLAKKHGYRCMEVPVQWTNDPESKVSMTAAVLTFLDLATIRWHDLMGHYK